jgi:hypothetical protein
MIHIPSQGSIYNYFLVCVFITEKCGGKQFFLVGDEEIFSKRRG